MKNKIVVTGMGVVSPVGIGLKPFWENLLAGKSGISHVTHFDASVLPTKIAGEINDFDPSLYVEKKEVRRMDRVTHFAIASAKMAFEDSGLDLAVENPDRIGVYVGTGVGGILTLGEQYNLAKEKGLNRVSPFFVPMMISNIPAGQISIALGLKGPSLTCVTACASSGNSVGEALRILQYGDADVMVAGGTEAAIQDLCFAGFCSMKAMSTRNDDPKKASSPFDAKRDGFVMGEGSAMLVLETEEHALKRGARIYCQLAGYSATCDAHHITAPSPGGEGVQRSMRQCLVEAGLGYSDVDYINAHGTSTPLNDQYETEAIKAVFAEHATSKLLVSSTKSMTGHMLGAAGALELIVSCLAIRDKIVPPTINYEDPQEGLDLDYVPNIARKCDVKVALSNSLGFGGHNATLLVKEYAE